MNDYTKPTRTDVASRKAGSSMVDELLADIAIRIQLSPTQHHLATERYERLDQWIQRDGSPLYGLVDLTYAQGSMKIGATINSRVTNDEFDIDAVTQLALPPDTAPHRVLDLLFEAVRGTPQSRYFRCARRRSRCVTISYADGMHVDFTPAIRQPGTLPRESWIFEHKLRSRAGSGRKLTGNPYGFAKWFLLQMPEDRDFSRWFLARAEAYQERVLAAEPVPPPVPADQKSRGVVALQLLKRYCNVRYDKRAGRRPPSVVLSKLVADDTAKAATGGPGLLHVLLQLAQTLLAEFEHLDACGRLLHIANPVCPADILTDRWPGNLDAQATFTADLRNLVADLQRLQRSSNINEIKGILIRLFGEAPALKAIEPHLRAIPRGPVRVTSTGGVIAGTAAAVHAGGRTVPRHTFHGDGEDGL